MMTVKTAEYTTWWRCSQNGKNDLQPTQFIPFLLSLWFHMLCSRMSTIEQSGSLACFYQVTKLFKQCQAVLRQNSALEHCHSVIQEIWRLKEPCIFSKEWSSLQWCRVRLKRDGTRTKTRFGLSAKWSVDYWQLRSADQRAAIVLSLASTLITAWKCHYKAWRSG
jgi:hypothetical protein